jgi:hypothetical protein
VRPENRKLAALGIWSIKVRGVPQYREQVRAALLEPGVRMRLVREPDNAHDSNAIAVFDGTGVGPIGYVDRDRAKRMARSMDLGVELDALLLRAGKYTHERAYREGPIVVLAAEPLLLAYLRRCRYDRHHACCPIRAISAHRG